MSLTATLLFVWALLASVALVALSVVSSQKAGPFQSTSRPAITSKNQVVDIRRLSFFGSCKTASDDTCQTPFPPPSSHTRIQAKLHFPDEHEGAFVKAKARPLSKDDIIAVDVTTATDEHKKRLNAALGIRSPFFCRRVFTSPTATPTATPACPPAEPSATRLLFRNVS